MYTLKAENLQKISAEKIYFENLKLKQLMKIFQFGFFGQTA